VACIFLFSIIQSLYAVVFVYCYLYIHGIFAVVLASFHIQDPLSSDWVLFLTSAITVSTQTTSADYLVVAKDDSRAITIIRLVSASSRPRGPLLDPEIHNHPHRGSPAHIGMRGRGRWRRKVVRWAIRDLVMPPLPYVVFPKK
jgi:hypothetical protein